MASRATAGEEEQVYRRSGGPRNAPSPKRVLDCLHRDPAGDHVERPPGRRDLRGRARGGVGTRRHRRAHRRAHQWRRVVTTRPALAGHLGPGASHPRGSAAPSHRGRHRRGPWIADTPSLCTRPRRDTNTVRVSEHRRSGCVVGIGAASPPHPVVPLTNRARGRAHGCRRRDYRGPLRRRSRQSDRDPVRRARGGPRAGKR